MATLVMNINNTNNLNAMVQWCKQYHIEYEVMDNHTSNAPTLVDDSTTKAPKRSKNDKKFPELTNGDNKSQIGDFVTVYSDIKAIRYWECGFTPDKVKYGIKKSLIDGGATWDSTLGAYTFSTKKAFDAWCKAQKSR